MRRKSSNADEVVVPILVLKAKSVSAEFVFDLQSYLKILSRNLHFVELAVLELDKPVAEDVQRLETRTSLKDLLVFVPPVLELPDVLLETGFRIDDVGFEDRLQETSAKDS